MSIQIKQIEFICFKGATCYEFQIYRLWILILRPFMWKNKWKRSDFMKKHAPRINIIRFGIQDKISYQEDKRLDEILH